jgi:hypothetical protein
MTGFGIFPIAFAGCVSLFQWCITPAKYVGNVSPFISALSILLLEERVMKFPKSLGLLVSMAALNLLLSTCASQATPVATEAPTTAPVVQPTAVLKYQQKYLRLQFLPKYHPLKPVRPQQKVF